MFKYFLIFLLFCLEFSADATIVLTDVARDTNGQAIEVGYYSAIAYCHEKGLRVPSIRELADLAAEAGAEVSDTPKNGLTYYEWSYDFMYYDYFGYKFPNKNFKSRGSFWSASKCRNHGSSYDCAYWFTTSNAFFSSSLLDTELNVVCVVE